MWDSDETCARSDDRGVVSLLRWLNHTPLHPQWFVRNVQRSRLRHLHLLSGDVLDIGCADRAVAKHLPPRCRYVGLDYYATVAAFYATRPDVFGDACALPIRDGCMDGVMLFEVLEHVPDPQTVLAEIARVLRPGGILLLSVPFMYPIHNSPFDFHRFTRHGLERALTNHGLIAEAIQPRQRALEVAGLVMGLALGDACLAIWRRHRWALPVIPLLASLVLLGNLLAWTLAHLLPGSDFMPGGYQAVAIKSQGDSPRT